MFVVVVVVVVLLFPYTGCILTTLTLSQAVDPIRYHDDVVAAYEKLIREDPHRRGYYEDQKSKFIVQTVVYQFLRQQGDGKTLDLSHKARVAETT